MVVRVLNIVMLTATFLSASVSAVKAPLKSPIQIKRAIKSYEKRIKSVSSDINKIEKKLERANRRYLSLANKRSGLSGNVEELNYQIGQERLNITKQINKLKKRLHHVVMVEMGGIEKPEEVIALKILKEDLFNKLRTLKRFKNKTTKLQKGLSDSIDKMKEISSLQHDLVELSDHLENEKREKALSYIKIKKRKSALKDKLKKARKPKRKLLAKAKSNLGYFTLPIEKRVGLDYKKKGVTFLFSKSQPLLTTRAGKVIHIGSLSTYGNVIMIDHGNETRSVLLGDFKPKVKKGMSVREGQVLGYSRLRSGQEGKVYFEVRKKNKVYKTINLIKV